MKKLLINVAIIAAMGACSAPVFAENRTYTERECSTDSYGNTTCRDKTTNVETGVITYSNQTVNGYATGSTIHNGNNGYVTYGQTVAGQRVAILNTGLPTGPALAAGVIVALGSLSLGVKSLLRHLS